MPSEIIRFLVMLLVAVVLWLAGLYRYGLAGGLITGFVIALWFATTWVYLGYALRSNSTTMFYYWDVFRTKYIGEIFLPLGICYLVIAILTFIADILVRWHQTGSLDKTALGIWFVVAVALPLGYKWIRHGIEGYKNLVRIKTELKISLRISHPAKNPIAVDRLGFIDSSSEWNENEGKYRYQYLVTDSPEAEEDPDDGEDESGHESGTEKLAEWDDRIIPLKTDKLLLGWYSIMEDRYYRGLYDFPLEQLDKGDYEGHQFVYGTVDIMISPDGLTKIYVRFPSDGDREIASFTVDGQEISEEQKREFGKRHTENDSGTVKSGSDTQ